MKKLSALLGYDEIEVHDGHVTLSEADMLTVEANLPNEAREQLQKNDSVLSDFMELLEAKKEDGIIKVPLSSIYELELVPNWTNEVFKLDGLRPVNNCIEFTNDEFMHFTKIHS